MTNNNYEEQKMLVEHYEESILKSKAGFSHTKTGYLYYLIGLVENCTNAQEGQVMVVYKAITKPCKKTFVREITEFDQKFKQIF